MHVWHRDLREWYPIYLRFLGSLIIVACVVASIVGVPITALASAYLAGGSMIAYKEVFDARRDPDDEEEDDSGFTHMTPPKRRADQ